jgi:hypothetical protein
MKIGSKTAMISISLVALATVLYFTMFKKTESDYRKMIIELVKSKQGVTEQEIAKIKDLTDNKMSKQELIDAYLALYIKAHPNSNQKYQNDVAFNSRVAELSKKYNIFS